MSPLLETFGFSSVRGYRGAGGSAAPAYELIATAAGNGSSDTVAFASIPAGYKHLQMRMILGTTAAFDQGSSAIIRINGNTTANKTFHQIAGNGSQVNASSGSALNDITFPYIMVNGNAVSPAIVDIVDAFSTTNNKTLRTLTGYAGTFGNQITFRSSLWPNTTAITSISIIEGSAYIWATRARFSLYGIKG